MTTASATVPSSAPRADDDDASRTVVVYNCSRLGLRANPPGFSITDWFRRRR